MTDRLQAIATNRVSQTLNVGSIPAGDRAVTLIVKSMRQIDESQRYAECLIVRLKKVRRTGQSALTSHSAIRF
jgi:hypothetical protein